MKRKRKTKRLTSKQIDTAIRKATREPGIGVSQVVQGNWIYWAPVPQKSANT